MYFYFLIVIVSLTSTGQSKRVSGPCPIKITEIKTFDIPKYLGTWYDIYTDPSGWGCPEIQNCTMAFQGYYHEGTHMFAEDYYYFLGDSQAICSTELQQNDYDVDARLFTDYDDNYIYILETDYENYSLEVGCYKSDDKGFHDERTTIRSRTQTLDESLIPHFKQKVIDFGFAEPELIFQDHSNCHNHRIIAH